MYAKLRHMGIWLRPAAAKTIVRHIANVSRKGPCATSLIDDFGAAASSWQLAICKGCRNAVLIFLGKLPQGSLKDAVAA